MSAPLLRLEAAGWRSLLRHDHPAGERWIQSWHPELVVTAGGSLAMECAHGHGIHFRAAVPVLEFDHDEPCVTCGEAMAPVLRRMDLVDHRWYRTPVGRGRADFETGIEEPLAFALLRALARPSKAADLKATAEQAWPKQEIPLLLSGWAPFPDPFAALWRQR